MLIFKPVGKLWNINLEDETVVAIGAKNQHGLNSILLIKYLVLKTFVFTHADRVHSHGKVLGDRSVLYKYLNPNMISVVTEGVDSQKVPYLNVYIVDTVNGNIITSFNHKRAHGPVHIVHSENWFFVSIVFSRLDRTW